jgi:hypothetical protein
LATRSSAADDRGLGQALAVLVGQRRQRREAGAGEGDLLEFLGLARIDHFQVLQLLQPFLDQPVGEAAQAPAQHVGMAADLDHAEQAPVLEREIHLEGEVLLLPDRHRQRFLSCGSEVVDQGHLSAFSTTRYRANGHVRLCA